MLNLEEVLFGTMRRMHHVRRYSSVPLIHDENVAEHSWQVAMISYLIGLDLRGRGITIAMETLLERAISHDLSEAISGDIIRSFKHSSKAVRKAIEDADYQNTYALTRAVWNTREPEHGWEGEAAYVMFMAWQSAKDGLLEGQVVALADMLCVVSKCIEERRMGNKAVNYILQALYEEVIRGWRQSDYLGLYVKRVFPNDKWDDPYIYTEHTP